MPRAHPPLSSQSPKAKLLPVGYITKAHGIRGELVMVLQAESPDILIGEVFARHRHGGETKSLTVTGMRKHHGNLLLCVKGVTTRNDAELLRSHTIFVSEEKLPPLDENEVYSIDLPGMRVFVEEGGAKREIGVITDVSAPAGQDLWTITTADGAEILFPAVEDFILAIEPDKGRVLVAPPPGLLELYLDGSGAG